MGTCKDCKHWGSYPSDFWEENKPMTVCEREGYDDPSVRFEIEVSAADDTDLNAYLVTGPDFGCIHFERKN